MGLCVHLCWPLSAAGRPMVLCAARNNLFQLTATTLSIPGHGQRNKWETKSERKGVKECKEQFLWSLGLKLLGLCGRRYRQTIINFRRRGWCDDSPGVKCPIETTAQCVYFLCLSIQHHYSSFSACACQPHHLQTHTKKMQMLMKFQPVIYQALQKHLDTAAVISLEWDKLIRMCEGHNHMLLQIR